jgi:NADH-quinone oxidoreductase subunit A
MGQLLQTYLPLVIFIGIAFFISGALVLSPFLIAVRKPDRPMNAASIPLTMRA